MLRFWLIMNGERGFQPFRPELAEHVRVLTRALGSVDVDHVVIAQKLAGMARSGDVGSVVRTSAAALHDPIARPTVSVILQVVVSEYPEMLSVIWGIKHDEDMDMVRESAEIIKFVAQENSQDPKLLEEIAAESVFWLGRRSVSFHGEELSDYAKERCEVDFDILRSLGNHNANFVVERLLGGLSIPNEWVSSRLEALVLAIGQQDYDSLNVVVDGVIQSRLNGRMKKDDALKLISKMTETDSESVMASLSEWKQSRDLFGRIAAQEILNIVGRSLEQKQLSLAQIGAGAEYYAKNLRRHIKIGGVSSLNSGHGYEVVKKGEVLKISLKRGKAVSFEINIDLNRSGNVDQFSDVCAEINEAVFEGYRGLDLDVQFPDELVVNSLMGNARRNYSPTWQRNGLPDTRVQDKPAPIVVDEAKVKSLNAHVKKYFDELKEHMGFKGSKPGRLKFTFVEHGSNLEVVFWNGDRRLSGQILDYRSGVISGDVQRAMNEVERLMVNFNVNAGLRMVMPNKPSRDILRRRVERKIAESEK